VKEMKNNDININLNQPGGEKVSSITKALKSVADTIANAKWTRIVKVYFVVFFFLATALGGLFIYNLETDKEVMHKTAMNLVQEKKEEGIRDFVVTPKVQKDIEILLYTLNADRVFIFELHNGKKNISGLPFKYADMTYEVANRERGVDRCYTKYQDVPLTMYKYPDYMHKKKFMIGTVDDIEKIDYEFAKCIREDGGEYLAMVYINGTDGPLAFLGVSYHNPKDAQPDDVIEERLKSYGKTIGELIDLKVQINKSN
jgi:hypothetical protein